MAARESDLEPYRLEKAVASDCREHDHNCFAMDVGHNDFGQEVESLQRLNEVVDYHLDNSEGLKPIRKLYIIGAWRLTSPTEESEGECQRGEPIGVTKEEEEWHQAGKKISKLVSRMTKLEELTWMSNLPFTEWVWEGLSTSMTKIILDIGYPVRLMFDGYKSTQKGFISSSEMKPLVKQTKLKELRLFHMQDSYQSIIWETLYRNSTDEGMLLLDITMAVPPLVRSKDWRKASDVAGLAVAVVESGDQEYKGIDGKGILHYSLGTGEYLDYLCMRKARIAVKSDCAKPLPLQYLKLDGFVVDHLPFEEELTSLELLTCGEKCVDAGLRAPNAREAPYVRRSGVIDNALSQCMIVWPNWHGIFDASTHQRIKSGVDVPGSELLLALPTQPLVSPAEIPLPVTPEGGVEGDDKYFGEPGPMVLTAVEDEEADKDDGSNALDHSDTTNDNDSNASDASAETAYYSAESE